MSRITREAAAQAVCQDSSESRAHSHQDRQRGEFPSAARPFPNFFSRSVGNLGINTALADISLKLFCLARRGYNDPVCPPSSGDFADRIVDAAEESADRSIDEAYEEVEDSLEDSLFEGDYASDYSGEYGDSEESGDESDEEVEGAASSQQRNTTDGHRFNGSLADLYGDFPARKFGSGSRMPIDQPTSNGTAHHGHDHGRDHRHHHHGGGGDRNAPVIEEVNKNEALFNIFPGLDVHMQSLGIGALAFIFCICLCCGCGGGFFKFFRLCRRDRERRRRERFELEERARYRDPPRQPVLQGFASPIPPYFPQPPAYSNVPQSPPPYVTPSAPWQPAHGFVHHAAPAPVPPPPASHVKVYADGAGSDRLPARPDEARHRRVPPVLHGHGLDGVGGGGAGPHADPHGRPGLHGGCNHEGSYPALSDVLEHDRDEASSKALAS